MPRDRFVVDRLLDRGLIDRWGFLLFAFGGAALILLTKSLGLSAVTVSAGAAILMALYAYIVQSSGTGRLRSDQAGDNCYYLGLIYTLASLGFAIFSFDPGDTATTIVQGFGVALATTVMGLILRVFFNQMRVDLVQTEDTARIELAEAAGALKAQLQAITVSMNDYGRETRQSLEELREQVIGTISGAQGGASQSIGETAAQANAAMARQAEQAAASARRLSGATDKVVEQIERQVRAFTELETTSTGISSALSAVESASSATQANLLELGKRADELSRSQQELKATDDDQREITKEVLRQVQSLEAIVSRFDQSVTDRLADLQKLPKEIVTQVGASLGEAAEAIRAQLNAVAATQGDLLTELGRRAEEGVGLVSRHNAALESELDRSRANVAKVHGALVEMTDRLTAHVQGQPG